MILVNNLLLEEHRQIWEQARAHVDKGQTNTAHPVRAKGVPDCDPQWDYNTSGDTRDQFTTCLLVVPGSLCKATLKPVNYEKLHKVVRTDRKIHLSS